MKRLLQYVVLGLVLLLVAMSSALTAMRFAIHGREVGVPKFIGMSPQQAENAAHATGLMLAVENRFYSSEVPEGRVLSQVPAPGDKVRSGWVVRVAQSLGPQRTDIPNLVGESPRAAEINVRRRGLELGSVALTSIPDSTADEIIAQSPPANAVLFVSPRISVLVSAPNEPQQYVMPSFIGMKLSEVATRLEDAGFKLGEISDFPLANASGAAPAEPPRPASIAASPTIVKQNPAPGEKVAAGATISFDVARM